MNTSSSVNIKTNLFKYTYDINKQKRYLILYIIC